jgi:hypothetical protein
MSRKIVMVFALVTVTAFVTILFSMPIAVAQQGDECTRNATTMVCESPGNSDVNVVPPTQPSQPGYGVQNGPYGPFGDIPPVGDN